MVDIPWISPPRRAKLRFFLDGRKRIFFRVRRPGGHKVCDQPTRGKRPDRLRLVQQLAAGPADGVVLGGSAAMRAYSDWGRAPRWALSVRSGWPCTLRTARENSLSADALMSCTANPSATPSMTATTAAAVRHGWARKERQEKRPKSRRCMSRWCWLNEDVE